MAAREIDHRRYVNGVRIGMIGAAVRSPKPCCRRRPATPGTRAARAKGGSGAGRDLRLGNLSAS
ncbi:hypothetical protein QFZ82_004439 [Streptomyces sp. V4I23]|nr:hypothetical protein [Streptomyces sp. V4I23]